MTHELSWRNRRSATIKAHRTDAEYRREREREFDARFGRQRRSA
ncbi:hypothetical protein BURMUCGD2M_5015 [Burkholderia multivorans CGD2M]|uniref:Uncharacterized protein n=1 Tax=Burkholderia multivorans CGD2 TaxID=513052 RepID=B9BIW6_9BURK|nr:hypothetical protein BURMUCGD2_5022 [Burkholderia multivorans CGD2]EEE15572.1 hypothetical protein BURMUCGD2M_5015 [Burkholderia multivorans CGD2M]